MSNRRTFLKAAGLGIAAASVSGLAQASVMQNEAPKTFSFQLGVASYSLRNFSQEKALDMTLRCGINRIAFKSMHLPLDSSKETIQKAVALCKQKGIALYGGGVIYMKTKDEVDQAFEYAKTAGMERLLAFRTTNCSIMWKEK
jgi:hypothetical protein